MFAFLIKQLNKYSLSIYFTLYSYLHGLIYTYTYNANIFCVSFVPLSHHTHIWNMCARVLLYSCLRYIYRQCKTILQSLGYMLCVYRISFFSLYPRCAAQWRPAHHSAPYIRLLYYLKFNIPVSTRHDRNLPGSCSRYPRLVQIQSSSIYHHIIITSTFSWSARVCVSRVFVVVVFVAGFSLRDVQLQEMRCYGSIYI